VVGNECLFDRFSVSAVLGPAVVFDGSKVTEPPHSNEKFARFCVITAALGVLNKSSKSSSFAGGFVSCLVLADVVGVGSTASAGGCGETRELGRLCF